MFRSVLLLVLNLVLLVPVHAGEAKPPTPDTEVTQQDLAVLTDIVRVLCRKDGGELPVTRDEAAKYVAIAMGKVSTDVRVAVSPSVYFMLGDIYWAGWGKETGQDAATAQRFYWDGVRCCDGKLSSEYMTYGSSLANITRKDPAEFINYTKRVYAFLANGTEADLYRFLSLERVLSTRRFVADDESKRLMATFIRENAKNFLSVTTDEGTLKRYRGDAPSLTAIADALKGTPIGDTAAKMLTDGTK